MEDDTVLERRVAHASETPVSRLRKINSFFPAVLSVIRVIDDTIPAPFLDECRQMSGNVS
jgi:hypothetical protein